MVFNHGEFSRNFRNSSLVGKIISRSHKQQESLPQEGENPFCDTFPKCWNCAFCFWRVPQIISCSFIFFVGSLEEQWYLEIVDKGSVSCPTCQAVGRKTIEGLKKHMENCKQVRYFVAFHDCYIIIFYPKFRYLTLCRIC